MFGVDPRKILEKAIRGEPMSCLSEEIPSELRDVLQRPKLVFPMTIVNKVLSELAAIAELITPAKEISEIEVDPADNPVLEYVLETQADYLVSADNHLLDLVEYASIRIVALHQCLALHG